jgi:hypothetical protein
MKEDNSETVKGSFVKAALQTLRDFTVSKQSFERWVDVTRNSSRSQRVMNKAQAKDFIRALKYKVEASANRSGLVEEFLSKKIIPALENEIKYKSYFTKTGLNNFLTIKEEDMIEFMINKHQKELFSIKLSAEQLETSPSRIAQYKLMDDTIGGPLSKFDHPKYLFISISGSSSMHKLDKGDLEKTGITKEIDDFKTDYKRMISHSVLDTSKMEVFKAARGFQRGKA